MSSKLYMVISFYVKLLLSNMLYILVLFQLLKKLRITATKVILFKLAT